MKKVLKVIKHLFLGFIVLILLFMCGTFIFGKVADKADRDKIKPYGQKVEVFGNDINVYSQGQGEETIVMLTGYGTPSPTLDFTPMIDEMAQDYRVVVIEPFGYGLSDETKRERTPANMVEEIHAVLEKLGIKKFIIMGHSIAGIYTLNYVNTYPEEVTAFIGIDTSVPEQETMEINTSIFKFLKQSGLLRLSQAINPDSVVAPVTVKEDQKEQYRLISKVVGLNNTQLNELGNLESIFASSRGLKMPADLPIYLFVQKDNEVIKDWQQLHENQRAQVKNGKMMMVSGDHYLHHTQAKLIADESKAFLRSLRDESITT